MTIDEAAIQMLAALADRLVAQGKGLLLTGFGSLYGFERLLKQRLEPVVATEVLAPGGLDAALEWCENRLLLEADPEYSALTDTASLSQQLICRDFTTAELDFLQTHLVGEERPAGRPKGNSGPFPRRRGAQGARASLRTA